MKSIEQEAEELAEELCIGLDLDAKPTILAALRRAEARGIRRAAETLARSTRLLRTGHVAEMCELADAVEKGEA